MMPSSACEPVGPTPLPAASRITGTMLADLVRCEMRVQLDLHGDPAIRAPVSGFVEMLWRQGNRHEEHILDKLAGRTLDLRKVPIAERAEATIAAMECDVDWIFGARLLQEDMEGRPDLLHREGGMWTAGDVKAGDPLQPNGRDPRREYAAQVGHYAGMLGAVGGAGDRAFVIGSKGLPVWYDMAAPVGRDAPSLGAFVGGLAERARAIRDARETARPALSSQCGMCVWRSNCRGLLDEAEDLTLVPGLGRSVRKSVEPLARTVADLADVDVNALKEGGGRTSIAGLGAARLVTFRERARMLVSGAPPYSTRPLGLERHDLEHHLDLETDPTADDFVYLHGIWRRRRDGGIDAEDYVYFLAEDRSQERDAFAAAVDFLSTDPAALITTFSAFEKTTYRRLVQRYPEVGTERVEALFTAGRCVDLYFDVILKFTHWPLNSLGLKAVAKYLGFRWDDKEASGAASIAWFVEWAQTRDPALLERILQYNRDDCLASRIVFDGVMALPVMPALPWREVSSAAVQSPAASTCHEPLF